MTADLAALLEDKAALFNALPVDDDGYYGDADIAWLLGSRLVTDTEDGTTVYRLFHDLLRPW
ncbi:hypothetical protein [Actinoplanes auranticolor]|uniref:Uncharacterized protein n=1 Tax=Actinoplanes auranticolor TaxID=47988 RepID=A0A919VV24_9ACTN|nr:hypothetical protein [Actinoplanes auranticolor]GIM80094.1 hypothetical protein Aau02nite_88960 [Actinoplanes auranticolor]